jgi:hypothetical protein
MLYSEAQYRGVSSGDSGGQRPRTQVGCFEGKRIHAWAVGGQNMEVGKGRGEVLSMRVDRYESSVSSSPRRLGRGSRDGEGRSTMF